MGKLAEILNEVAATFIGIAFGSPVYERLQVLVLESKADMQKRGQASPDDGDAVA